MIRDIRKLHRRLQAERLRALSEGDKSALQSVGHQMKAVRHAAYEIHKAEMKAQQRLGVLS